MVVDKAVETCSQLLEQLFSNDEKLSEHKEGFIKGRIYQTQLLLGAMKAQYQKEVKKEKKRAAKPKNDDEAIEADPLAWLAGHFRG